MKDSSCIKVIAMVSNYKYGDIARAHTGWYKVTWKVPTTKYMKHKLQRYCIYKNMHLPSFIDGLIKLKYRNKTESITRNLLLPLYDTLHS